MIWKESNTVKDGSMLTKKIILIKKGNEVKKIADR